MRDNDSGRHGGLGVLLRWRPNPTWLIAAGATVDLLRDWLS